MKVTLKDGIMVRLRQGLFQICSRKKRRYLTRIYFKREYYVSISLCSSETLKFLLSKQAFIHIICLEAVGIEHDFKM